MKDVEFDIEKVKSYFKEKVSDTETSYIYDLFSDNCKEAELKRLLSKQFDELSSENNLDEKNLDQILYKIHYAINTNNSEKKTGKISVLLKWSVRIAGVLILTLSIFWGVRGYFNFNNEKVAWVEVNAPAWTRVRFSLPDGTTGWLNSNSSLKYNGTFNTDRIIILKGEAFFNVFEDKSRPFRVNTNDIIVTALGTRFNIASYDNEREVEVVLEEGKIEVDRKERNNSFIMKPHELALYDRTLKSFTTKIVEPQKYLSWTEGKLVFRNDPVDVIVRKLERWYNVDFVIKGNISQDIRLRATFVDESLEQVLFMLKRSLPIDYFIEESGLTTDETYAKKKVVMLIRVK